MKRALNKKIIIGLITILSLSNIYASNPSRQPVSNLFNINDGPYIFYNADKLTVKWIKNNKLKEKNIKYTRTKFFKRKFDIHLHQASFDTITDYNQHYKTSEKIAVISDIHGQYDTAIELLKKHNIIDSHNNWIFGKGHLVVLGDIFDRGDKVTELLWLVYNLEKEAHDAGGKVHYLMGNHELMIFMDDLRYVNEKYLLSASMLGTNYTNLFLSNSLLGRWLHQKPVLIKINNILFSHAGISPDIISKDFSVHDINKIFAETIYYSTKENVYSDTTLKLLSSSKGPIWYRGYFSNELKQNDLEDILNYFDVDKIIVGHTSLPNITHLYNGKLIDVDSSIKMGNYGEILIIENEDFYRGTLQGGKIKIPLK